MSTTLFVRSYPKDFHWLDYSVISMDKYLTGIDKKILVVPIKSRVPLFIRNFFDEVIESYLYEHLDGYVAQQFDKLDAPRYVDTDYILYSDSDTIFKEPFDISDMFHGELPVLYMTPYTDFVDGLGACWQAITERFLGFSVSHEFMRRQPILHRTETVKQLTIEYPNILSQTKGRELSEFNLIGAFAFQHNHPYYFTEDIPPSKCKQYWSWSGMTDEERAELDALLP